MNSLFQVYQQMGIMFFLVILGVWMKKRKMVSDEGMTSIANIIMDFAMPALIFHSLATGFDVAMLQEYLIIPLIGVGVTLLSFLVVFLWARYLLRLDQAAIKEMIFINGFSNTIFLGLPLLLILFGQQGVILGILYDFGQEVILWTVGIWLLQSSNIGQGSLWKSLFSPPVIALLLGVGVALLNLPIPEVVLQVSDMVGNVTVPLAMMMIGAQLAKNTVKSGFLDAKVLTSAFMRLLVIPMLTLVALNLFQLSKILSGVVVVEAAMPIMVSTAVIMHKYKKDTGLASRAIFLTTILAVFTLPLLILLLRTRG